MNFTENHNDPIFVLHISDIIEGVAPLVLLGSDTVYESLENRVPELKREQVLLRVAAICHLMPTVLWR